MSPLLWRHICTPELTNKWAASFAFMQTNKETKQTKRFLVEALSSNTKPQDQFIFKITPLHSINQVCIIGLNKNLSYEEHHSSGKGSLKLGLRST